MHGLPQLTSATHSTSLVTHDSASPRWRLVRKGIAPAFATANMKCAALLAPEAGVLLAKAPADPLFNCACRKEFPKFVEIGQQVCKRRFGTFMQALVRGNGGLHWQQCLQRGSHAHWPPRVQLVTALKALGPEAVVDVDLAAQRESLVRQQQRVLPWQG